MRADTVYNIKKKNQNSTFHQKKINRMDEAKKNIKKTSHEPNKSL